MKTAIANRVMAEMMKRDYGTDHELYQSPHTSTHPVLLREFLEWLIRVAHVRPSPVAVLPPPSSPSPSLSPSPSPSGDPISRIDAFFKDCILLHIPNLDYLRL